MGGDTAGSVLSRREEQIVQRKLCQGLAKGVRAGKEGEDGSREKVEGPRLMGTHPLLAHLSPTDSLPRSSPPKLLQGMVLLSVPGFKPVTFRVI